MDTQSRTIENIHANERCERNVDNCSVLIERLTCDSDEVSDSIVDRALANSAATGSVASCTGGSYWKMTPSTTSSSFSICYSMMQRELRRRARGTTGEYRCHTPATKGSGIYSTRVYWLLSRNFLCREDERRIWCCAAVSELSAMAAMVTCHLS